MKAMISLALLPVSRLFDRSPFSNCFSATPHESSCPTVSPLLICLVHPAALTILQRAIGHVKLFRLYLGSQTANVENAQIAKDILIDTVDFSGVDLPKLESILGEAINDSKDINCQWLSISLTSANKGTPYFSGSFATKPCCLSTSTFCGTIAEEDHHQNIGFSRY
jgi:hypothetical protein